jgi:hypothetical protein
MTRTESPGRLRAAYDAADPKIWRRAVADARALDITEAVNRRGREAVSAELAVHVSGVDKLLAAARDTRADPQRLSLALAVKPAIMRQALFAAAPAWRIEPTWGMVSRHYDAAGNEITDTGETGEYFRAVRVDLGAYCYGLSTPRLRTIGKPYTFVMDGQADDPAEAVRLALAEPLPVAADQEAAS